MGLILLPSLCAQQPQQPTLLDLANPLTNGLISVIDSITGYDLLAGAPTTNLAGRAVDGQGVALKYSTSQYMAYPFLQRSKITNKCTYFMLADGEQILGSSFLFGDAQATGAGYNSGLYSNGSNYFFFIKTGGNGTSIATTTLSNQAVKKFRLTGTYDGVNLRIYFNGNLEGTTAKSGNVDASIFSLNINRWNAASAHSGLFYFGLVYNRALSAKEVLELSNNPWQIFLAAPRRFWLNTTSGIAFDAASNSGYQAASSSYTFNRTVTGTDTFLSVDVSLLSAGQTVTSVIDDFGGTNTPLTFIGAKSTVSSVGRVECWGLAAPTSGTKTIQVNLSGSIASSAAAASYTGVHQTNSTEAFNSAQATNVGAADATVDITTIADNCWVHGAIATNDTAITANQTSRNNVTGAGGSGANEDNNTPKTPAGVVTMSYTNVDALATWAIAGYALRPIAASGLPSAYRNFSALIGVGY